MRDSPRNMSKQDKETEVLAQVEKFIEKGELDEAFKFLNNCNQKEELSSFSRASCHLYQCKILFWQGKYKELVKLAELTYKESNELQNCFLLFDSFILLISALARTEKFYEAFDMIKQGEVLLNEIPKELTEDFKQREASLAFIKGTLYMMRAEPNDINLALGFIERSLELRKSLGIKHEIAESLDGIAGIMGLFKGELDHAIEFTEQSLVIAKESREKYQLAKCLSSAAALYSLKGDLSQSTLYFEESLKLFKQLNNKPKIAGLLNNMSDDYKKKGDLDHALECIEQAMDINRDMGYITELANNHDFLIQILIDKGDLERSEETLKSLEKLNNQVDDKLMNAIYLLNKAIILKSSSRAIKRGKAEEILKQLLEDERFSLDELHVKFRVLLNLCELLLTELRITNDVEVMEELNHFIGQLLELAENSHSYWIMGETYLLQAKLALVFLDLKQARLLLTQGQQLAESHGLHSLAAKLSNEHDELLIREKEWETIDDRKVSITERIKRASINGIMDLLQGRKIVEAPEMIDEEPILLLIMDKGGVPYFNHLFAGNWDHTELFGAFMSAFNTFSDELFSKSIDRIRIGENTILINPVDSFLACYVIKGQSYPAFQKLMRFTDAIRDNSDIWQALKRSVKTSEMLELDKPPILKSIINEIFIW